MSSVLSAFLRAPAACAWRFISLTGSLGSNSPPVLALASTLSPVSVLAPRVSMHPATTSTAAKAAANAGRMRVGRSAMIPLPARPRSLRWLSSAAVLFLFWSGPLWFAEKQKSLRPPTACADRPKGMGKKNAGRAQSNSSRLTHRDSNARAGFCHLPCPLHPLKADSKSCIASNSISATARYQGEYTWCLGESIQTRWPLRHGTSALFPRNLDFHVIHCRVLSHLQALQCRCRFRQR